MESLAMVSKVCIVGKRIFPGPANADHRELLIPFDQGPDPLNGFGRGQYPARECPACDSFAQVIFPDAVPATEYCRQAPPQRCNSPQLVVRLLRKKGWVFFMSFAL